MEKRNVVDVADTRSPEATQPSREQLFQQTIDDIRRNPLNVCIDALTEEGREAMRNALSRRPLEGAFVQ